MLTLLTLTTALAQEMPAAIPADGPYPPPQMRAPQVQAPPPLTPERLAAFREYDATRLTLRPETEVVGGGAVAVGGGWVGGWRPTPRGAVHVGVYVPPAILQEPPTTLRTWGVYEGPKRLSAPEFLQVAGDSGRYDLLNKQINRADTARKVSLGVAGAVLGVLGGTTADNRAEAAMWDSLLLSGLGVGLGGFVVASFPAAKADRLTHDYTETLTLEETRALVQKRNEALRQGLGLSPEEAWRVESKPSP